MGLVVVGVTLGAGINRTGKTTQARISDTQARIAESVTTQVEADARGAPHLVDKASGNELTVRAEGDTFIAVSTVNALTGRKLVCLPIADVAQMVHDLSTGTQGSLVIKDEHDIEKKILSIAGDFEDNESSLQFGSFTVLMDDDACAGGSQDPVLDINTRPALEAAGVEVAEAEEEDGVSLPSEDTASDLFNRLLHNTAETSSFTLPRYATAAASSERRSAVLQKNRRAYAMAHEAVKDGRNLGWWNTVVQVVSLGQANENDVPLPQFVEQGISGIEDAWSVGENAVVSIGNEIVTADNSFILLGNLLGENFGKEGSLCFYDGDCIDRRICVGQQFQTTCRSCPSECGSKGELSLFMFS